MNSQKNQLLGALVSENILDINAASEIEKKALAENKSIEDIIISKNIVDEEKLTEIRAKILDVPAVNLSGKQIQKKILNLIPKEVAENYQMVPFEKIGNEVHVALINPQNFKAIEAIEFLAQKANLKIKYFITSPSSFNSAFKQFGVLGEEVQKALAGIEEDSDEVFDIDRMKEMEQVIKNAPVSKMVLVIIRHAIDGRASDIHIEPTIKDTRVRYRIDGILRTSLVLPKYIHSAIIGRIKVLANLKIDETRKPQDGRIRLSIEDHDVDFRVSTLPLFEGEKIVLRILDTATEVPTLEDLGFNPIHINIIKEVVKKPHGLLLLTGPTGSGKTTTLYTILTMLNQEGTNIVTLEDPIEYYVPGVNQSNINPDVGYTFASGLRSILRQDPNVIMVGEIRDKETTELVIHASLTGHLMLSTLHTNNAVGSIPRLIDLGAEPFLLSSVLNLVIAQRLARRICPDCKKEIPIPQVMLKKVKEQLASTPAEYLQGLNFDKLVFYKGQGCSHCGNLGYKGRIAVSEAIIINNEIREIISRGGDVNMVKVLKDQNFITLTQDCLIKALKGLTTIDEVIRVSQI